MYIDVEFRAVLLSRKETDYKFDDGKEVTGYKCYSAFYLPPKPFYFRQIK